MMIGLPSSSDTVPQIQQVPVPCVSKLCTLVAGAHPGGKMWQSSGWKGAVQRYRVIWPRFGLNNLQVDQCDVNWVGSHPSVMIFPIFFHFFLLSLRHPHSLPSNPDMFFLILSYLSFLYLIFQATM